jgi:4-hydroxy-2-oxoheptanedioate aldolase
MVASGAEARSLVSASRYPPIGARSYGAIRSPFGLGREQVEDAERNVLVFAMIETREGLDHVDEIAATRGLDGVYVGPADLSLAIGSPSFADLEEPSMLEALDAIVAAAERHGIVAGIHAPSPAASMAMAERGFRLVSPVVDEAALSRAAADDVSETRARLRRA